ncbi:cytochrome P450 [Infundibulicybe gibba]|nr:cytochrome P450 [Infundibulicybe gibba]
MRPLPRSWSDEHQVIQSPKLPMLELMDCIHFNIALLPHGDMWRRHRRIFQQSFRRDAAAQYEPIEIKKVHQMLRGLLETPHEFREHIRTVSAAIIMAIVYGLNISAMNDKYVLIAEEAVERSTAVLIPGASLVNSIPVLRYLPPWLPGVKFHRLASEVKKLVYQMLDTPFEFVRENMVILSRQCPYFLIPLQRNGTGEPCLLRTLLEANDANDGSAEYENVLKGVSMVAYAAGADTTSSFVATFFYAMAINPDVQRKAQREIDAVVGNDRLPEPRDRPSLPYVEAIYREVMRWRPVVPLGIPHMSTEDDVYNGYFIPKGSIVFPNIWAMTHNENIFTNPDKFQPERYFDSQGNLNDDDTILAFGFGRRVCAGQHLASTSVWLIITNVLAALSIAKAKDSQGNDIEIEGGYTDGAVNHPHPFLCSITPRSPNIHELINSDE